jgi:hypothetical protein
VIVGESRRRNQKYENTLEMHAGKVHNWRGKKGSGSVREGIPSYLYTAFMMSQSSLLMFRNGLKKSEDGKVHAFLIPRFTCEDLKGYIESYVFWFCKAQVLTSMVLLIDFTSHLCIAPPALLREAF